MVETRENSNDTKKEARENTKKVTDEHIDETKKQLRKVKRPLKINPCRPLKMIS